MNVLRINLICEGRYIDLGMRNHPYPRQLSRKQLITIFTSISGYRRLWLLKREGSSRQSSCNAPSAVMFHQLQCCIPSCSTSLLPFSYLFPFKPRSLLVFNCLACCKEVHFLLGQVISKDFIFVTGFMMPSSNIISA